MLPGGDLLAVAVLIGGRVFAAMKRSLGAGEWVRRGIGVAMLAGVAAIATGLIPASSHASRASPLAAWNNGWST